MLRSAAAGLRSTELRIDLSSSRIEKPFYTTLDTISGRVVFSPRTPVVVNDIVIDFLGSAKTWVDPITPGVDRKKVVNQVFTLAGIFEFWLMIIVSEDERRQGDSSTKDGFTNNTN